MQACTLLAAFLLSIAPVSAATEKPSPEENILRRAGIAADGDGLLTFFRGRTLSDTECKQIGKLIHQLGAENFDDRESAAKTLQKIGSRATPLLRAAKHDPDVEIAKRVEHLLKDIAPPAPLPAVAAARLLAHRAPADAVPVLLAYLPFTADGAVEDEVLAALLALTPEDKADPALTAALTDPAPIKRGAAAYVVGRKGDKAGKEAVRKLLADADGHVRWQAANALLTAHDKAAVPALMDLLADGPFDTAWRSEEVLHRLAGDKITALWLDDTPKQRGKVRDAWAAWWKEKGAGFDLTGYTEAPRPLGYTLGVEYNTGRVWECDIDGSIRWELRDLAGPMDAQVLPNGNVLIAEAGTKQMTERDLKGVVKWAKKIDEEPTGCERLANGNLFVSTSKRVIEIAPGGATINSHELYMGGDSATAHQGPEGRIYFFWGNGIAQQKGKTGNDLYVISLPHSWGSAHYVDFKILPGARFLAVDSAGGSAVEVKATDEVPLMLDVPEAERSTVSFVSDSRKFSKILWEAHLAGACCAKRLPNGNTLVGANHMVVAFDALGNPVWEKATVGYVRRVHWR